MQINELKRLEELIKQFGDNYHNLATEERLAVFVLRRAVFNEYYKQEMKDTEMKLNSKG